MDNLKQLFTKRISGKHKNNKFLYYLSGYFTVYFRSKYNKKSLNCFLKNLNKYDQDYIEYRTNYYNKLNTNTTLPENTILLKNFKFSKDYKTYYIDTFRFKRYFNPNNKIRYLFGDIIDIPEYPTLVKSRPISDLNICSVLLNLNKVRHFTFVKDTIPYDQKINKLIWRGKVFKRGPHRVYFFEKHYNNPICKIGAVNKTCPNKEWIKNRLTIEEQLAYKFILSIEGNDVATNLKWVMSSNSIAVMPKPKYETWFMEGTLIPDYHYIEIKEDYSDLTEKLNFYTNHPDKAKVIIKNANTYVKQFKNKKREKLISLLVLKKYFEKTV